MYWGEQHGIATTVMRAGENPTAISKQQPSVLTLWISADQVEAHGIPQPDEDNNIQHNTPSKWLEQQQQQRSGHYNQQTTA